MTVVERPDHEKMSSGRSVEGYERLPVTDRVAMVFRLGEIRDRTIVLVLRPPFRRVDPPIGRRRGAASAHTSDPARAAPNLRRMIGRAAPAEVFDMGNERGWGLANRTPTVRLIVG
jgi:hypothetical protein